MHEESAGRPLPGLAGPKLLVDILLAMANDESDYLKTRMPK